MDMPRLPAFTMTDAPERPATGFGFTAEQLIGSGTGELIERYAAAITPDTFPDIPVERRTDLTQWLPFTNDQYQTLEFPFSPPPPTGEVAHVWAVDPISGDQVGVPADLVYLRATGERQWCTISSNGLAAHRTAGAAARAAVFELIERDSFLRAWYGGFIHPVITLEDVLKSGVLDPAASAMAKRVQLRGVRVRFVKMPAVGGLYGVLACARSETVGLAVGCAAKPTLQQALRAAFIECVHTHNWATTIEPARFTDEMVSLESHIALHADPVNKPLNAFIDSGSRISVAEFLAGPELALEDALSRCASAGWTVYLADVTSSDVRTAGWHVIRALSPDAATLDVTAIHRAQLPVIANAVPHPFP